MRLNRKYLRLSRTAQSLFATLLVSGGLATSADAAYLPSAIDLSQPGISGAWYDPKSAGQGFVISVMPASDGSSDASYFAGWFTFSTKNRVGIDVSEGVLGAPQWFSAQGKVSDMTATYGPGLGIYTTNGKLGLFDSSPKMAAIGTGWAYVSMVDCDHMHFRYEEDPDNWIDPQWHDMDLVRLLPNVNCSNSIPAVTPQPSSAGLSGAWYDPTTSGQGFAFEFNPNVRGGEVFGGWFTYLPRLYPSTPLIQLDPGQDWYTLQGPYSTASGDASVGIFATIGGAFAAPNTPSTVITTTQVGTAFIHFSSCSKASISYQFFAGDAQGLSRTIQLQRLGPAPAYCTL